MIKPLGDRIKYMNRPEYGSQYEANLFKKACHWIGQDVPTDTYFQVRLMFNRNGFADQCYCEVFQNNVSLGEYDVLDTKSVHDVVTFT